MHPAAGPAVAHAMDNLILIGPMGAGKTSIGRRLAARLGLRFVDADRELERRTGACVALIFELEGEEGFRRRERELLAELCARRGYVIATGGGAVLDADNRRLLRASGYVVHLHAGVPQQLSRLRRDGTRPLLQAPDRRQKLEALAALRAPLYAETAHLRFDSDGLSVPVACEQLHERLLREWRHDGPSGDATADHRCAS